MKYALCLGFVVVAGLVGMNGQQRGKPASPASLSSCSPTPAEMKRAAAQVGTSSDALERIDRLLSIDTNYMLNNPALVISHDDDLMVLLIFPYQAFRSAVSEAIRKREPVAGVHAPDVVAVSIVPRTINAKDIVKVIVERDGKNVLPMASSLKATPLQTRIGPKTVVHAGTVAFPCSAFAPGAKVVVTAIPDRGDNIEKEIDEDDREMFSPARLGLAFTLVGLHAAEIEARLGRPTRADPGLWSYEVGTGMFRVYMDASGLVTRVDPPGMPLSTLNKR